ncbi:MAG: hypothetical protein DCC55_26135, partial [Chloroflexi bacterium]
MLELKLLGSPQILLHGRPVPGLSAAKSQALLFYLALTGRPQSRLALAGLLWPEKREADALANLRQALYHLRHALPDYLVINRLTVAFNQGLPCQIDVVLFEQALGETDTITGHQEAVDRYSGEFLAGFYVEEAQPFEDWAVVIREGLHDLATQSLCRLVAHFVDQQDIALGLRYANQWLALDPWSEVAYRQKIRLLAWNGQAQAALAHYERCRQVLKDELGVTPGAETVRLAEQIRAGKLDRVAGRQGDKVPESPRHPGAPSTDHDWGEAPEVGLFHGRQAELNQLTQWLVTEQSRLVTVVGMGGMGKTALAAKLTRAIANHFPVVIWRSLLNAPPLMEILGSWLQLLAGQGVGQAPASLDLLLNHLFELLRERRCLLVLDNVESILQGEGRAGHYRPGYEGYGQLFQRFGAGNHQSCLLITSREQPHIVAR